MKALNLVIFCLLTHVPVYAQIHYEPFQPYTFTPQVSDNSILQRSFEANERREEKAYKIFRDLVELCQETAKKIPPTEADWFKSYSDGICGEVDSQIEAGNFQTAIRLSNKYLSQLHTDNNVIYRIDSYKHYCDDMEFHGLSYYKNGRVSKETYDWFCYKNQYKFSPKYDALGTLIGYIPVDVSYLLPSINWNEAFQFITSRGRTQEDIDKGWSLYFDYDPTKMGSLRQEYEVMKFYYDYYLSICDNPNLNIVEKEQLLNIVRNYKAILFDAENRVSYEVFVTNMKKQLVVQPSYKKQSHSNKKRSTSSRTRKHRK